MYSSSFNPNGSFRNSSPYMSVTQPQPTPDHFHFKERRGRVDWRLIAPIDVNRLMRDGDIDALQSLVETLTFADLESEAQHRYSDPEFVKVMRICQLAIEYLLHVQDVLDVERKQLRERAQSFNDDMLELNNQLNKSKEEINMLKRDLHQKKKMVNNLEMMLKLPVASARLPDGRIFKCPLCLKIFATCQYLENHIYRRHPEQATLPLVQSTLASYQNETIWQNQADFTKRERDEETLAELKQLRELKERLTKETERLTQTERDMRTKLEDQLNQERANFRKKEDEMEKVQMDQRLRYEEELRNFQSSMRKELFDHKLQIADQQRKAEEGKEKERPKTSVGVLESDDEGMNRKTLVESQIKDAVSKAKEDFEKQLASMKEKAAREQEQNQMQWEEEKKRAAMEKKRATELAQQEMEKEREKVRLEREKAQAQEKERLRQEIEQEKAQNELKLKKQMQKQQQLFQQKEQQLKEKQLQQQQKMEHLKKQQLLQQQQHEEEERRRLAAQQRKKKPEPPKQEIVPFEEPEEEEEEEEEEDEPLINLQVPQVAKFTPFPDRPYLKALFDHSLDEIDAEHADIVAQVSEELGILGVPATGLKKNELEKHLAQLEADKLREEEILKDFPLDLQQNMQEELRRQVEDLAGKYYIPKEEKEEPEPPRSRTPSISRRGSAADISPNARRPPPSPSLPPANAQRKLSQQLAQEAVSKKGNLRSSATDLRSSVDSNSRTSLKNPSPSSNLPPNKKSRTQQRGRGEEDEEMEEDQGDHYYNEEHDEPMYTDEDEEIPYTLQKQKQQLQKQNSQQLQKQNSQQLQKQNSQQLQKPRAQNNVGKQQLQPRQLQMREGDEDDEDEDFDDDNDDLVVSNSNVSSRSERTHSNLQTVPQYQNPPKNNKKNKNEAYSGGDNGNPGFRSSTELASFEVSDDDVDESLSSLQHLAKKNQPPKQQQQQQQQPKKQQLQPVQQIKPQPPPAYDKDEDFDDDDLDDDIYASAPPPSASKPAPKPRTDDDDLNDFLAETEDVLGGSKYGKSAHRDRDDAVEKSYDDDVGWDEVMEM